MQNDIAKAIYDILKADATLRTALTGTSANGWKIYHILARQNAGVPFVTFGLLTDTPLGTFTDPRAIDETFWWVNIFASGSKEVGTIAGFVTDILDNASLTVAGYTSLECILTFIGASIYNEETENFQVPIRYRIRVDKN